MHSSIVQTGAYRKGPDDDSWDHGVGWHVSGWGPPVKDLAFDCGGTSGILQDWYDLPSFLGIPEKFAIVSPRAGWEVPQLMKSDHQSPRRLAPFRSSS